MKKPARCGLLGDTIATRRWEMKQELGTAGSVVGMIVLSCLFGGLVLAIYPGWFTVGKFLNENLLLSKEAPAWVQAVGSIAGIGIAIYVPWSSHRRDVIKQEREAKIHAAVVISGFRLNINPITSLMIVIANNANAAKHVKLLSPNLAQWPITAAQRLQSLPLISNEDLAAIEAAQPKTAAKLARARGNIQQLILLLPGAMSDLDGTIVQAVAIRNLIDDADKSLDALDGVLDEA